MGCGEIKTITFSHLLFNYQICEKERYNVSGAGF